MPVPDDPIQWHDNIIYALHLEAPEPESGLWHSNLILDIDHIVEWVRGNDGNIQFRVAPATLTFHDVTDLCINIDFRGDMRQSLNELSISAIVSEKTDQEQHAAWRIEFASRRRNCIWRERVHAETPRGSHATGRATSSRK